ncbi:MAG: winged helix-turn-helix domain-containing protein, partial [Citrobacter freundii]|nr:winged helix-turn-helix domain-containing protein [Citrobacter freundii]
GEILSRERLLRMLSARRVDNPDLRTVDVLIRRLRHKLRADLLVTQHGEGYFLAADVY